MRALIANCLISLVLLTTGFFYFHKISSLDKNFIYSDYGKFYQSLRFALTGKSPYTPVYYLPAATKKTPHPTIHRLGGNLNPPFFNLLLLPLGLLSYIASFYAWEIISILSGVLGAVLLKKVLDLNRHSSFFLTLSLITALFIYYPTYANVWLGQVALFVLPLLASAWLAASRGHANLSAILLALAASIKLFFGLFFFYFLLRKEWRALGAFIITLAVCYLLPLVIFGKSVYADYQKVLDHIVWYTSSWNASLYGFSLRLFSGTEKNIPIWRLPELAIVLYVLLAGGMLLTLIKFLRPDAKIDNAQKTALDFALISVTMLLLAPLGWMYYFAYLFVPITVLLALAHRGHYPYTLRLITCFAVILTSIPYGLKTPSEITGDWFIASWAGAYTYGLLLLFALLVFMRQRLGKQTSITDNCPRHLTALLYVCALLPSFVGIIASTYNFTNDPLTTPPKIEKIYFGDLHHADLPSS